MVLDAGIVFAFVSPFYFNKILGISSGSADDVFGNTDGGVCESDQGALDLSVGCFHVTNRTLQKAEGAAPGSGRIDEL